MVFISIRLLGFHLASLASWLIYPRHGFRAPMTNQLVGCLICAAPFFQSYNFSTKQSEPCIAHVSTQGAFVCLCVCIRDHLTT